MIPSLVSGLAFAAFVPFIVWQLVAVGILVRAMIEVLGIIGSLF
jgi:hypothetical protein